MNKLKVGFARVNVNPAMGIGIGGYYKTRIADGILDDLELNALALSDGRKKLVIITIDHCGLKQIMCDKFRKAICDKTGLPVESVLIHAVHTHTAPYARPDATDPLELEYIEFLTHRFADVATFALEDLKPAKMGYGFSKAPNIAFVRRFRMKDGSVKTNPGVDNPDILAPIGDVDETVNVIRFNRGENDDICLINFADHPDTVGGNKLSADWFGFTRRTFEKAIDGAKCIALNGAQGDINHVNVHPRGGDLNDMFMDFDDVSRGYGHARHMGRVVAGAAMQVYDKVKYVDVDEIKSLEKVVEIPSNMPTKEQAIEAHRINDLHEAGKDNEIPYEGMMLTTVVAEAFRMVTLEHGPEKYLMKFFGFKIGGIGFVGIPGEPFMGIGRGIREESGYDMIITSCLSNGSEGYFPMKDAYEEGGYEARSSYFKEGTAEFIIEKGKEILEELKK